MDFTLSTYKNLIKNLKRKDYNFLTVEEYLTPTHPDHHGVVQRRRIAQSSCHNNASRCRSQTAECLTNGKIRK